MATQKAKEVQDALNKELTPILKKYLDDMRNIINRRNTYNIRIRSLADLKVYTINIRINKRWETLWY